MVNLEEKVEKEKRNLYPEIPPFRPLPDDSYTTNTNNPIGCSGCVVLQINPATSKIEVVGIVESPLGDLIQINTPQLLYPEYYDYLDDSKSTGDSESEEENPFEDMYPDGE